jgi:queuine/archaeosine tRNA-ribosyltransferase
MIRLPLFTIKKTVKIAVDHAAEQIVELEQHMVKEEAEVHYQDSRNGSRHKLLKWDGKGTGIHASKL